MFYVFLESQSLLGAKAMQMQKKQNKKNYVYKRFAWLLQFQMQPMLQARAPGFQRP